MKILVKTLKGLEPVLFREMQKLGVSELNTVSRGVEGQVNWSQLYKCNYLLRTAIRVLVQIESFDIANQEDLYEAIYSINWEKYFKKRSTFSIDTTCFSELFSNSHFMTLRAKDAIVDQLRDKWEKRPSIKKEKPDILINLHLIRNRLNVSLDASGFSLHLRNYKYKQFKAPLNEVLAAGILLHSDWDKSEDFYDPMTGSGTFTTEAIMQSANIPSGYCIDRFSFQNWPEYFRDLWISTKELADSAIQRPSGAFYSSDLHPLALTAVRKNLQKLKFSKQVEIEHKDFFTLHAKNKGVVFLNPPYDIRIKVNEVKSYYRKISDHLKSNFRGCRVYVISNQFQAMKHFGLKADTKIELDNGGIPSKLYKFELYGS